MGAYMLNKVKATMKKKLSGFLDDRADISDCETTAGTRLFKLIDLEKKRKQTNAFGIGQL